MRADRNIAIAMPLDVTLLWHHTFRDPVGAPLVEWVVDTVSTVDSRIDRQDRAAPLERNAQWREHLVRHMAQGIRQWQATVGWKAAADADAAFRQRLSAWAAVTGHARVSPPGVMQKGFMQIVNAIDVETFAWLILKIGSREAGPVDVYQSNYGIDRYYQRLMQLLGERDRVTRTAEQAWAEYGIIARADALLKPYLNELGLESSLERNWKQ